MDWGGGIGMGGVVGPGEGRREDPGSLLVEKVSSLSWEALRILKERRHDG